MTGGILASLNLGATIGLVALALVAAWICQSWFRLRHIPGRFDTALSDIPRMRWILGNSAHDSHVAQHRKYGPIVRFGPNMVSVADPAEIPHIYGVSGDFKKSNFYRVLSFFVNGKAIPGLFATQDENIHRLLRRPIAGMYSMTSVVKYEPFVESTMRVLFDQMDERFVKTQAVCSLDKWLQMFAFDVIGEITFSKRLGFLEQGQDIDNIMHNSWMYFYRQAPKTQMTWLDDLWEKNPLVQRFKQTKLNPIVAFARARQQERNDEEKKAGAIESLSDEDESRRDFLSRFMEVEKKHEGTPPWAVAAWATSNVTAGSDTTAILLRTIFYNLIKHPESLAKLRKELEDGDLGTGTSFISWKQALNLPFLDAVIKEAGRLHPPFALPYERVVPRGGATVCGQFLPEGTVVGISSWVVHRDFATFGNDSDNWRPERWLECNKEQRRKMENALLTFGSGHRSCIGKNISYLEVYKLVPTMFKLYNLEFAQEGCPDWKVENRWFSNQTGLDVRLSKRDT